MDRECGRWERERKRRSGTGEIKCKIISVINHLRVFVANTPVRAHDFFHSSRSAAIAVDTIAIHDSRQESGKKILYT